MQTEQPRESQEHELNQACKDGFCYLCDESPNVYHCGGDPCEFWNCGFCYSLRGLVTKRTYGPELSFEGGSFRITAKYHPGEMSLSLRNYVIERKLKDGTFEALPRVQSILFSVSNESEPLLTIVQKDYGVPIATS